ncbi:MAG: LysM peptidoglycan-binding domain-containing protein [Chloroflexi bacterium]|nr:MAG: LysM peptidoglycan-binding domain-containing protein [Chloroflexota bacterium]
MSVRRILPFVLLNVVVSAVVVLAILFWWDRRQASISDGETAVSLTVSPTVSLSGLPENTQLPTDTPTPEPANEPLVHIVQPGETLGSISEFYDVPLDDIVVANNLTNPNFLEVGQALVIPVGGVSTPTPEATPTTAVSLTPTPIPTEPATSGEAVVEITEVVGVGILTEEAVQIRNFGSSQIALAGWILTDEDGNQYTFGQITLFGDGAGILLHTESGLDGPTDLYWGLDNAVWESGETATLMDMEGNIRSTLVIP